ncbi:MAG: T9SS type A sorting domain-containing protein [Bacteroidales bacterium]|nr:T9SS type A sorting domain-containing protein [Bacteroidales bacterium]
MKNVTYKVPGGKYLMSLVFFTFLGLLVNQRAVAQEFAIDFGRSTPEVVVAEDNLQQLNLHFSYKGIQTFTVETEKGLQFNEIFIPGAYAIGGLGTPKLPASKKLIEIPFGAEVTVSVKNYTMTEYQLSEYGINFPIIPNQPSIRKDQDVSEVPFEYDEQMYKKDFFIEHEMASVEVLGVLRGYRIARVTAAPVSYNPAKGILRVYNDIEVEISYSNVDAALTDYVKASTWSPYFQVIEKSLINNLTGGGGYPSHPDLTKYPVKYLIVSHRMFENDLQPFIEWKTKKGFEVIVAYTDVIGTTYAQIQTWVHGQYNQGTPTDPAPSFVLFVGDTPQIPATTGSSSGKMTDLYYASVDGDYFPEMYYGRFSATNSAQLVSQIAKTLYYEKYEFTDPTYLDGVTLIAGADGTWNPRVGQPTVHYGTINYFNAAHGYTNVYPYLTSPYTGCYSPEKIAVSMINYTAHCSETSWGDPNLSISMVNAFTNNGKYPIAIGNCCLAADFGYGECIGEVWQRSANKGSVAYLGSSPSSYWFEDFYWAVGAFPIQGTNNGYVPTFEETTWGAYDAPFVSDYVTTGSTNFVGNLAVTEVHIQGWPSHSSPTYYWQAYNVLGDPSLVPYHTQGSDNTVSHMAIVPIGMDYYEVTAEAGSYVGISKDGVLHGSALVGETGVVEVPLEPILSGGMVDIVVTKPQRIPYMVQIPAAALEGPYVVLDSYTISDLSGNNNGLADYGENISVNVTLKNVGADPSAAVVATISGTDQYITLTSAASQNFGPIANGGTATVNSAYSFSVTSFVPDQHKAQFTLTMTDGSDTWTSNLFITLQAPVVVIADSFIIDDSQSGNNDGILDPGETALVKMNVNNTGHSNISNAIISIVSNDPMLTINTASVNIASIAAGGSEEISISVSADASSPIGYPVNVNLSATAGPSGLYTDEQTITVVIGLIPEYNMSNQTVTTCVGLFYDSGGPGGEYGNNESLTMTFLPASTDGVIKVNFLSFETESNYDYLYIYNGPNASSPQVPGSPFHGTTNPGIILALNGSGALTFKFTSDGSITKIGWEAEVSCHYITGVPECASNPNPADEAVNVPMNTTLTWVSLDATLFDVYFGVVPNPPFVETATIPSYSPTMMPNTTYYWKIVPKNSNGQATNCPVWSFTTSGPEYMMGNGNVTAANGMFYDSGGPGANYASNENFTMTFFPANTGQPLEFTFTIFDTEANYDYLHIHNGPDISAPAFPGSPFHGTTSPVTVTSTHASGAITFKFTSDNSVVKAGWAASFQTMGTLTCNITSEPEMICQGGSAMLLANPSGGTGTYNCTWSPAGSLSNPNSPNPIATPDVTTTYTVSIDDGETIVTDSYTLVVNIPPQVNLGEDQTVCADQTITLNATTAGAVSYLWTPGGYTTPTIQVDSTGVGLGSVTYSVVVTDANDCEGEDSIVITFDPCIGVSEINDNLSLMIFPNPATNVLNITLRGISEKLGYTLMNYQGQHVYSRQIGQLDGSVTHQIELGDFARGIYYLRLNTSDDVIIRKVVIQ